MCGVGAFFSNQEIAKLPHLLDAINSTQAHRGPDGSGTWMSPNKKCGLAHTRLSIIDLTNASAQPLISHDGRYVISFNGEIYNYKELREECIAKGSQFRSSGDVEVIVEMYRHFGKDISRRLRGMWSFLIIDTQLQNVFVSRDPFGIKPLFYGEKNGVLVFASEIKSFHKIDPEFTEIDQKSLELFKEHKIYDRGNWTFFEKIKKFPAGHYSLFELNKIPDWDKLKFEFYLNDLNLSQTKQSEKNVVKKLRTLFEDSMKIHMRSDVPVGFCLSGGIDSSSIVSVAKKIFPESQLKTFTTQFKEHSRIDETNWAQMIIDDVQADATFVSPNPSQFIEDLPRLIEVQDEPFGSASIYSQYCIFRAIGQSGVKVVLDGQGADEVFAGYHSFFPYYVYSLIEQGHFLRAFKVAHQLKKNYNYDFTVYNRFLSKVRQMFRNFNFNIFNKNSKSATEHPIQNLFYSKIGISDSLENRLNFLRKVPTNFDQFLIFMVFEGNIPMLLRFEDRNSMAFSVESRVPFLIKELVEFSLQIPSEFKMKLGIPKYVLRKAMQGIVPQKVLDRMDKLGFPAPDKEWMKQLYNADVDQPFSSQWIDLILNEWQKMLARRREQSLRLMN